MTALTPSAFIAQTFARKLIRWGGIVWRRPWRGRKATVAPADVGQEQAVRRRAVRRVDLDLADVVEERVEARTAEHPDLRLARHAALLAAPSSASIVDGRPHRGPILDAWPPNPVPSSSWPTGDAGSPSSTPTSGALAEEHPEAAWSALGRDARAALPDAPAVAGPGRRPADASAPATGRTTRRSGSRSGLEPEPPPAAGGLGAAAAGPAEQRRRTSSSFHRIGSVAIPFAAGERRLSVFWMEGYAGGLFLAFRDATNGAETYGAGRYLLDAAKSADLGGDPERGHADPRLQLRLPAVVRVRPAVGLPARAAREPARPADPGRRADRLRACGRLRSHAESMPTRCPLLGSMGDALPSDS